MKVVGPGPATETLVVAGYSPVGLVVLGPPVGSVAAARAADGPTDGNPPGPLAAQDARRVADVVGPQGSGVAAWSAPPQEPGSPWSDGRLSSTASPASVASEGGPSDAFSPALVAPEAAPVKHRLPGEKSRGKRPLPTWVGAPPDSHRGAGPSSGQAGLDADATIAAVGGPAAGNIASEARKPVKGISARRSREELQALLQAEPYPGPFPKQRPGWAVPDQGPLGDGALPPGAPAKVRASDLYPGKYEELVRPWIRAAARLMRRIKVWSAAGSVGRPPSCSVASKVVHLSQGDMPVWARGLIWDCADPEDCRPQRSEDGGHLRPSDSLDPASFELWADTLGWNDADIVHQLVSGGLRAMHEDLSLDTVLAFHHGSLVDNFAQADKVTSCDIQKGWISAAATGHHLPIIPARVIPRGVALQPRYRADPDGSLVEFFKPRVTTDESFPREGEVESPNAATPACQTAVELPMATDLPRAAAIIAAGGQPVGLYAIDFSDAYRYCMVHPSDRWTQCVLWLDGVHVEERGVFGQSWMPQRFQRISALALAVARWRMADFDRLHPCASPCPDWSRARAELPEEHRRPDYAHVYIDDTGGAAGKDLVLRSLWPEWLQGVDLGEEARPEDGLLETSAAAGPWPVRPWQAAADIAKGASGHPEARFAIHARIAVGTFRELGFEVSAAKLQIADAIIQLGFTADCASQRISVPDAKREAMLADTTILRRPRPVELGRVQRFVGRLTHMAAVLPDLQTPLRAGYHIIGVNGGNRRQHGRMVFTQGKLPSQRGFQSLLDVAEGMLKRGESVPFAARLGFPDPVEAGLPVFVTDASGYDGFGGWTIRGKVLVYCLAPWPQSVLDLFRANRFSVSAAELFAQAATAAALGGVGEWGVFIGDSSAACSAVRRGGSATEQMRDMLALLRAAAPGTTWLSAHVLRRHNTIADDLSKLLASKVHRLAAEKGLSWEERPVPGWIMRGLLDSLGL